MQNVPNYVNLVKCFLWGFFYNFVKVDEADSHFYFVFSYIEKVIFYVDIYE